MAQRFLQHTFPNGLTLVGEQMLGVQSAAMTILVPAGASTDPAGNSGTSTVLAELLLRGAGDRDNRQLTEYLDSMGLQRSLTVGVHHTRFSCSAVADRVIEAIPTYADIVQRPQMPPEGFVASRDLALQSLAGVDDEPRQKVSILLRKYHFSAPYNRNPMGETTELESLTLDAARKSYQTRYHAKDVIIAIAGNIDFEQARSGVEKHFGSWAAKPILPIQFVAPDKRFHFEQQQSEQTHIGIAYPTVQETDPRYWDARLSIECLSGGMSGRLFTEVREKRGLCYSVGASFASLKGLGSVLGYAGTSNDRAQATLDCFIAEVNRMAEGVTADELSRAKIGLKASLIMSGESSGARAGSIAHDFFIRGRIRTLDEISASMDAVTVDSVNDYLKKSPAGPFTIVIVGPRELKMPQ